MCYLALVGKSPDSSCHLDGKYDKQEEEELHSGKNRITFSRWTDTMHAYVHVVWLDTQTSNVSLG